jgi:Fe-Mn family superoxide dismutase
MNNLQHYIRLVESANKKLHQESLPVSRDALDPIVSLETVNLHFGKLAKSYVDRYNKDEGDKDFNFGGATLHNIFFAQLKEPGTAKPTGASLELIMSKYKSFINFKNEFLKTAMTIQGSGWVYMDPAGNIKTIKNHDYQPSLKIVLLIDWWEHSWILDYGSDKQKYLENIWRIINWSVVNDRLQQK